MLDSLVHVPRWVRCGSFCFPRRHPLESISCTPNSEPQTHLSCRGQLPTYRFVSGGRSSADAVMHRSMPNPAKATSNTGDLKHKGGRTNDGVLEAKFCFLSCAVLQYLMTAHHRPHVNDVKPVLAALCCKRETFSGFLPLCIDDFLRSSY